MASRLKGLRSLAAIGAVALAISGSSALEVGTVGAQALAASGTASSSDSTTGPTINEPGLYTLGLRLKLKVLNDHDLPVQYICLLWLSGTPLRSWTGLVPAEQTVSRAISTRLELPIGQDEIPAIPRFTCKSSPLTFNFAAVEWFVAPL
jgi:hypothetical protein